MSSHIPLTHRSLKIVVVAIQLLSHVWLFATPWTATLRLPCPPCSLRVCSSSCPLSWWCCLTISPSAAAFSFCLQSFPASRSFPMSWLFTSGGQSIGSSASVLPMNISFRTDWFPLGLTDLISLLDSQEPPPPQQFEKHLFLVLSLLYGPTLTSAHDNWKNHSFDSRTFVSKVMSLLSRFVIAFLPRSKLLLILWLQSPSAVILQTKKIKFVSASTFSPSVCHEVMGSGSSQVALVVKNNPPPSAGDLRDMGSIPGSGRSPGGGHSNPLQYSCLENPMHRWARWATVHSVAKIRTWLKWLSTHACDGTGCHDLSIMYVES